jgi:cardiolipin synthase
MTSIYAVMATRTSQGAIAWAIGLNTAPYVAVPAYWVLGQSKFDDYELLRRAEQFEKSEAEKTVKRMLRERDLLLIPQTPLEESHAHLLKKLSCLPITTGNSATLLIDGEATFESILEGMRQAQDYSGQGTRGIRGKHLVATDRRKSPTD